MRSAGSDAAGGVGHVVRIVGGGVPGSPEQVAIIEAVTQVLRAREVRQHTRHSAWSLAGRLEGVGMTTVRAPSGLPRA